ncbi:alpha,alpha-trehalase TreA [Prodigiosinella confusarubida]|uniref:Putative periplasmic trehalase n=1 Tax=Serratia sp. (strain ATCC 39006) TaxID=104623 RepID=A0A2I5TLN6_SERS3|nr:alpha,alpha-trehalase TreA [Serratia sp. ATCC 39006]AUH01158.1 alpha,alpha-trehalase TreA [Serratia sp. ATCC 39006]AUH05479.1 alpha,alpha-trehalase TreA [Serratia sp. ATCC 39006]
MISFRVVRRYLLLIILQCIIANNVIPIAWAEPVTASEVNSPPDVLFGPLFKAVQRAKLFPDQKTFADAVPKYEPSAIMADYYAQKNQHHFDLNYFVQNNFTLPSDGKGFIPPGGQTLREHINALWPHLTQSTPDIARWDSLLPLPNAYVVPGGRFREVYYWDSYFTMLGLAESGQWDTIRNMVNNFAWQIDQYGHIPNGNRTYYLSRSQPPFFSKMVELLATHDGQNTLVTYLPQIKKEYDYWMAGAEDLKPGQASERVVRLPDGTVLNRYWDERDVPRTESWLDDVTTASAVKGNQRAHLYRNLRAGAASGWDFSSRWLKDPMKLSTINITEILPVDLNSLIYHIERVLAKASQLDNHTDAARRYTELAAKRRQAINHYFWNTAKGYYADYDWKQKEVHNQLTAATLFPLYVQAATDEYANKTAEVVRAELLKKGGLATTTIHTGQQWDAPNGWAPLQWVAVQGLRYYHHDALARDIGTRFLNSVVQTYHLENKLVEKYDIEGDTGGGGGGEYPLQDGFGWTNGVTMKLLALYPLPEDQPGTVSNDKLAQ